MCVLPSAEVVDYIPRTTVHACLDRENIYIHHERVCNRFTNNSSLEQNRRNNKQQQSSIINVTK